MPKPALTRFSTLQVYNPDMQGITDLAPSDLPEFIVPQVTTEQADVLPNLQDGMIVYDTIEGVFKFRQEEDWISFGIGDGDVVGPGIAVNNNIVTFDGTSGKLIKDSGVTIDRVPEMVQWNTQVVGDPPVVNQLSNLGHLQFVGGLGVILMDDLIPLTFITRGTGADSQVCTVFSGDLPVESSSPSALVEINSTSGALLLSRLTTDQRLALQDPLNGMMMYDTTLNQFFLYQNNQWQTPGNITAPSATTLKGLALWGDDTGQSLTDSGGVILDNIPLSQWAYPYYGLSGIAALNFTPKALLSTLGAYNYAQLIFQTSEDGSLQNITMTDGTNGYSFSRSPYFLVDFSSSKAAIILPNLTQQAITDMGLGNAREGMLAYNKDDKALSFFNGSSWITSGSGSIAAPSATTENGLAIWGDDAGGSLVSPPIFLTTRFTSDIYYLQGLYGILSSQFVFSNGGNSTWVRINANDGQSFPCILLEATTSQAQILIAPDLNNGITLQASNSGRWTWTFPTNAGSAGQGLITDGNGNLSWGNALSTDQNGNATVQGYMQINGYLGYQLIGPQSYGFLNSTTPTGTGNHFSANVSLVCTNRIVASEFDAVSSAEIKNIVTSGEDIDHEVLELFRHIPFFKYTYKDTIKEGSMPHYGVVAEELSSLLPHLVIHHQNFVPNIYRNAQVASEEQGHFTLTLEHPLTVIPQGERLLLLSEDSEKEVTLLDVSENILCVRYDGSLPEKVFVYGTYKDCPSVSKQKIFEMGMVVLQNVLRRLENIEQKIMH